MRCNSILICSLLSILALVLSACDAGKASMAPEETNVLGIYKHVPQAYSPTTPNSITINSDELYTRKNFSGDKTTLLWGLVTIEDY